MDIKPVNPSFRCKVIVLNIKNSLYGLKNHQRRPAREATQQYWEINEVYRNSDEFKFAVGLIDGVSKTAYRVKKWFPTLSEQYDMDVQDILLPS